MEEFRNMSAERLHEPGMLYGQPFTGESVELSAVNDHMGEVIVNGKISSIECRELRGEFILVTMSLTDNIGNDLPVRMIIYSKFEGEIKSRLLADTTVSVCGIAALDHFENRITVSAVKGIKES